MTVKYAFIGGGNMAQAIIGGLLQQGCPPEQILVVEPSNAIREHLQSLKINLFEQIPPSISQAEMIILAVKPQIIPEVCHILVPYLAHQVILSIAAGITLSLLGQLLNQHPSIVRAMPNTPALIREGITGVYGSNITVDSHQLVNTVLNAIGEAIWFDNEQALDAVTAISGSGPAYYFYMMEAMIKAGIALGLTPEIAKKLVLQTAKGASQLASNSEYTPDILRKKVTSPNGTTQAAIESMQNAQIDKGIVEAINQAHARSIALAEEASHKFLH